MYQVKQGGMWELYKAYDNPNIKEAELDILLEFVRSIRAII